MGYLIETGGRERTAQALAYYRSIGWIGEDAEDELREYLEMFDERTGTEDLTMDHHARSLEYIAQLAGGRIIQ